MSITMLQKMVSFPEIILRLCWGWFRPVLIYRTEGQRPIRDDHDSGSDVDMKESVIMASEEPLVARE